VPFGKGGEIGGGNLERDASRAVAVGVAAVAGGTVPLEHGFAGEGTKLGGKESWRASWAMAVKDLRANFGEIIFFIETAWQINFSYDTFPSAELYLLAGFSGSFPKLQTFFGISAYRRDPLTILV
jgi:hypothetical protein